MHRLSCHLNDPGEDLAAPDRRRRHGPLELHTDRHEGTVELGGTVKMRVPEAPSRAFSIQVTKYTPNREMVWTQGNRVMSIGVRTYRLTPNSNHTTTFQMSEVFSGLMAPMVAGRLPDFKPIFERYAADLKREAEAT